MPWVGVLRPQWAFLLRVGPKCSGPGVSKKGRSSLGNLALHKDSIKTVIPLM